MLFQGSRQRRDPKARACLIDAQAEDKGPKAANPTVRALRGGFKRLLTVAQFRNFINAVALAITVIWRS